MKDNRSKYIIFFRKIAPAVVGILSMLFYMVGLMFFFSLAIVVPSNKKLICLIIEILFLLGGFWLQLLSMRIRNNYK